MSNQRIVLDQDVVVTHLQGKMYLVAADGSQRLVAEGDVLPKDAVLLAPEGASFQGGETTFTLGSGERPEQGDAVLANAGTPDDIAALQQAILDGTDPTKAFEASAAGGAPAAGNAGGVAGASGNGGFVTIDRTGDATISSAGFDSANPAGAAPLVDAQSSEDELVDLTAPVITVSAPDNTNDRTPTLTGTTDAPAGSTVTLVVTDANGNQQTLTATVQPDGSFSVDVTTPLAEGGYQVTASVTDPAGNTGTATDDGSVDTTAPIVTVNAPDNTNDNTPTITGTTDAAPGSTVTLTVTDANGNQQTLTATVQPDGSYSADVVTPLPDGGYDVTASVTDPAGNRGTSSDDGSVDTTANITVSLDDVNAANVANTPISGTSDVGPGRTVILVISDATGKSVTVTAVTDADGNYQTSADLSGLADGNLTVVASVTDAAGNPASATDDTTLLDTTPPDASITLDGNITPDDVINAAESKQDIAVTGRVGGDVKEGDTVTLTVNGKAFTGLVLADKTFSINVPGSDLVADGDKVIDAKVTTTDAAGNSTTQSDSERYSVDTVAPELGIDLDPIVVGGDNTVNKAEADDKASVTLSGTVSGDAKVGDTVTLTVGDGSKLTTQVVVLGNGQLGFSTSTTADKLVDGSRVTAEITVTDAAGNSTTQSDSERYSVDTVAPELGIDLDPIVVGGDNTVNKAEADDKASVTLSGTVSGDAKVGDTVTLTVGDGSKLTTQVVVLGNGQLGFSTSTTADKLVDGSRVTAEITVTDAAGNSTTQFDSERYSVDTTATVAPSVVIVDDVNNDQMLTKTEIGNDQIQVHAGVSHADLVAGGKVTLIINNGVASSTVELTLKADGTLQSSNGKSYGYQNGTISWTEATPGNGTSLTVTATQTDKAGNTSLPGSDTALVLAVPVTSGGYASGAEDTPLSLKWSDFKASDADTPDAQLSIKITSLPADGLLQYKDADGKWQTVTLALVNSGLTFSKGDIDAGKLQFLPDLHESSSAAGNNGGAPGNKLGDYAAFDYQVSDGVNSSDSAKFVIDIKPVVDGVTLKIELVSGGLTPGAAKVEEILDSLQGKNPSSNPTGGNDYLVSSNGNWVDGGAGNDTIKFGSGTSFQAIGGASVNEHLIGGDGDDILIGGKNETSSVKLQGDGGNDTLISQSLKATTSYYGGDGQDVAYMPGSMKALKLVTTGLPNSCDYRLVYTDPVTGVVTNHDFYSVETLYLQDGKYQFDGGQLSKVADLATLKIDADLIDTDGSERFTELTIKGLPQGAELSGGTLQADGSWKVPASMLDQDGKLSLQVELPVGSQNIKVTVVAGSQEFDMNGQPISGEVKFTEADAGFMVKPANPNGDNTVDGGGGDDVLLGDIGGIKTSVEPGKNYNVALIVDTSGSMKYGLNGSQNPSSGQDRMTLTINALKVLANQLASHDGVVNVTLIGFAGSAK